LYRGERLPAAADDLMVAETVPSIWKNSQKERLSQQDIGRPASVSVK
jgi:hypothetical protein